MRRLDYLAAAVTGMGLLGVVTLATPEARATTLTNFNSVVVVDDVGGNPGMNNLNWTVDGTSELFSAPWLYSTDGGATVKVIQNQTFVPPSTITNSSGPFDFSPSTLTTTYADVAAGVQFTMHYELTGGAAGSGQSNLRGQLTVSLLPSDRPASAHVDVIEYVDMDLSKTPLDDTVTPSLIDPDGQIQQIDSGTAYGESATGQKLQDGALVNADPDHREAGDQAAVSAAALADALSGTPAGGVSIGPGDEAYAYSYNLVLQSGTPSESLAINFLRTINISPPGAAVPEPATTLLSLLGLAAVGGSLLGRRSRRMA